MAVLPEERDKRMTQFKAHASEVESDYIHNHIIHNHITDQCKKFSEGPNLEYVLIL